MTRLLPLFLLTLLVACTPPKKEDQMRVEATTYEDMPTWNNDDQSQALAAFVRSCDQLQKLPPNKPVGNFPEAATAVTWYIICEAARSTPTNNPDAARLFFEIWFSPYNVYNNEEPEGMFTGYYEIELEGSTTPSDYYSVPIYAQPENMVKVNLQDFSPEKKGVLKGTIQDGWLKPLPERAAIEDGALKNKATILAYAHDPVEVFFLHIQGSGRIRLEDGSIMRIGYAEQNGHEYTAIGKVLIDEYGADPVQMSADYIRTWLKENPSKAREVLDRNASYVFFRLLEEESPVGAQGVPLTPERSLAVDKRYLPYGVPVWIQTTLPDQSRTPYDRLLIAQDTGGAIKGVVRGDVFFGAGERASTLAGNMKQRGRYTVLLPRSNIPVPQPGEDIPGMM
jgi:membrane-bound lytic murein transglycosylase A